MKLTGKCAEDFEEWFRKEKADKGFRWRIVLTADETIENALIIDFFDSLKIYIFIDFINDEWYAILCGAEVSDTYFNSRLEATNEAIKRVNNIYNEVLFT